MGDRLGIPGAVSFFLKFLEKSSVSSGHFFKVNCSVRVISVSLELQIERESHRFESFSAAAAAAAVRLGQLTCEIKRGCDWLQ